MGPGLPFASDEAQDVNPTRPLCTRLERGGFFASLAATFNSHVRFEPARVTLSEKGIPELDIGMRFKTALGLVAWTIIRLAQLRAHGHVVLRCAECREFRIVKHSVLSNAA